MSTATDELQARAAELREIVARPSEKDAAAQELAEVERQIAAQREAEARAEAEKRVLGIKRGYGGLLSTYHDADCERVRQAVATLREAITTLNARAGELGHLRAEADALADRFGLPKPTLPVPPEPDAKAADLDVSVPVFWRHRSVRPKTETCEHGMRARRTYAEVSNTPAYEIITAAGLEDFPSLTARQRELLAERVREQGQVAGLGEAAKQAADEIAALPAGVPAQAMRVHRG